MTTLRPFECTDLFRFNSINLDPLTETYNIPFYMQYISTWPSLCATYEDGATGRLMGYILGKAEGEKELWHGHVTAVTVSPEYRRLGVAKYLMAHLEEVSECQYNAFFVDLFEHLLATIFDLSQLCRSSFLHFSLPRVLLPLVASLCPLLLRALRGT